MQEFLFEKLKNYEKENIYPFHMPGHKRRSLTEEKTYSIDITEIDGFDNLQNPEGILLEMEKYAEQLYGTKKSMLLVNGSSAGILAAISAACSYGEKILVSRNCHKSVFNGIALRGLESSYLYPEICKESGLNGGITPEMVKDKLETTTGIRAVVITSPTYDGVISDVLGIAKEVHKFGIPLIVDEAHGAHLPFAGGNFPKSALNCGADIVIHSLHKTLPAFTQTGILHINSERVNQERVRKFLNMYQSTSPSYILLSGIGSCLKWLGSEGEKEFSAYGKMLTSWRVCYEEICKKTEWIRLAGREIVGRHGIFALDESKIIFYWEKEEITGNRVAETFLKEYGLQMEMSARNYCLALSSVFDREEGFMRLKEALGSLEGHFRGRLEKESRCVKKNYHSEVPVQIMKLGEALDKSTVRCPIKEAAGMVCGDYLYLYPPGIPLLLPGEEVKESLIMQILEYMDAGFEVAGINEGKIKVL